MTGIPAMIGGTFDNLEGTEALRHKLLNYRYSLAVLIRETTAFISWLFTVQVSRAASKNIHVSQSVLNCMLYLDGVFLQLHAIYA